MRNSWGRLIRIPSILTPGSIVVSCRAVLQAWVMFVRTLAVKFNRKEVTTEMTGIVVVVASRKTMADSQMMQVAAGIAMKLVRRE